MILAILLLVWGTGLIHAGVTGLKEKKRNAMAILIGGAVITLVGTIRLVVGVLKYLDSAHAYFHP
jgi:hypothetical protein